MTTTNTASARARAVRKAATAPKPASPDTDTALDEIEPGKPAESRTEAAPYGADLADAADAADAVAEGKASVAAADAKSAQVGYPPDYGANVLDECVSFLERFCVFPDGMSALVALWAAHTWAIMASTISPRLAFLSTMPASGKTRAMELTSYLSRNSRLELDLTGPTLATIMATEQPALFFDEVDTVFGAGGSNASHRQLRGILNSGYKVGGKITRKAGRNVVESIPVYGAVCFAGLGRLPDTLMSRSFCIAMKRRSDGQKIDRFMPRMHEPMGIGIGQALGDWIHTQLLTLSAAWPEIPEGIEDRSAECCEPILAIADAAGGHWPRTARDVLRKLYLEQTDELGESPAEKVLRDVRSIWPQGRTRVGSAELILALFTLEESPWARVWDPTAASRELSTLLASRGINVRKVKVPDGTGAMKPLQGYRKEDFAMAWQGIDQKDAAEAAAREAEEARADAIEPDGQDSDDAVDGEPQ